VLVAAPYASRRCANLPRAADIVVWPGTMSGGIPHEACRPADAPRSVSPIPVPIIANSILISIIKLNLQLHIAISEKINERSSAFCDIAATSRPAFKKFFSPAFFRSKFSTRDFQIGLTFLND
jgi:hypothetical protein